MRIAIDLQSCQTDSRNRGIGRYSLSLVKALSDRLGADDEIVIGADAVDPERLRELRGLLRRSGIRGDVVALNYPHTEISDLSTSISAAAGMLRSRMYAAINPDVILITSFFEFGECYSAALDFAAVSGVPTAVIAYDVIPLLFPERYLPAGQVMDVWYRQKIEQFKRFDLFLAISESTKRDLVERLAIDPQKVRVIGAGVDANMAATPCMQDGLARLGIRDPFVLMVGNADWRKNSMGALEAFAALPAPLRKQHQLVFTQVGEDIRSALKGSHSHLRDRVIIAGKVCEDTLAQLYAKCRVFFFPSLYEGFGLPVLEAMAAGAPVLSSDQGALVEVVHDKRVLFDPRDLQAGAALLRQALEDDEFRQLLLEGARAHASTFTWDRCAEAVASALSELVGKQPDKAATRWNPAPREIGILADACLEMGPEADSALRNGLEAISMGGDRRILVDVTEVVRLDARSGIQRVVRNYLIGLAALANGKGKQLVEPIQWTERGITYARGYARDRLGLDCTGGDDQVDVQANDLLLMLDSSWWSPNRFDDLNQSVRKAGGEVIWMVYDLVPINFPQYCDPGMPPAFRAWLEHIVPASDGFVCISEATRQDLETFLDETTVSGFRPWTRSLHLGSDLESGQVLAPSSKATAVCEQLQGRPWLVALGTIEPRKDYSTVLAAFERLWAAGVDVGLVVIGKQGWNVDSLVEQLRSHPEQGTRLFWLEGLGDGDVRHLLGGCNALIQASIAEGFGLPVVEAGSLGVPLLLSDIPVFHEIAGEEATYFPVGDPVALASIIEHAVSGLWHRPVAIRTMTWGESAEKLAEILWRNASLGSTR